MKSKSTLVVISDLRTTPLMAAIDIAKKKALTSDVEIIMSSRIIYSEDYGDFIPTPLRLFKLLVLRLLFKCTIVAKNINTKVDDIFTLGIRSSLLSITCDSMASESTYPTLYSKLVDLAKGSIEIADFITSKQDDAEIYIFNGRLSSTYPIASLYKKDFKICYYEYSNDAKGYFLYPFAIHDDYLRGISIVNYRNNLLISRPVLLSMAKNIQSTKLSNPFVSDYKIFVDKAFDVVVFLGSDHEYAFVTAPQTGTIAIGNIKLVEEVIKKYGSENSIAVRAHPNQAVDKNYETSNQYIEKICCENNIKFYPPSSSVSSYDLINKAKIVCIDVSSIGFDAVYLGKKVHVFGNSCLRVILSHAPDHIFRNKVLLADYVAENMAICNLLFLNKFNLPYSIVNQLMLRIEARFYRL